MRGEVEHQNACSSDRLYLVVAVPVFGVHQAPELSPQQRNGRRERK